MDGSGYVAVIGRIKDVIIRGGENIYTREIEDFLRTHPDVLDAAVVGVPDGVYGEQVMAWVEARPGTTLAAEDIPGYCADRLAHYKIPRHVRVLDPGEDFPMTVTGKVQKHVLRERARKLLCKKGEAMSKVLYRKQGEVAYVTLNRPEAMNAIDLETHQLLQQVWDFRDDEDLRVAIVTGAGDEAFCAGADLKTHVPQWLGVPGMHEMGARAKVCDGLGGLTRGLHRIYKPVVAAVNGWALAGGFETALVCDIRITSDNATFGSFEIRRGFHHADGGVVCLVNVCGAGFATKMLLTGEPIDAHRARTASLVSKVVSHDELMDAAEATVATILRNDQAARESAKETLLEVIGRPLDDQLAIEALYSYALMGNPTIPGRLARFHDKTDPGRAGKNATALDAGAGRD
ncbi:hypothetical protein GCM10010464_54710 [Pseudonocardia yunnanensis]|uniref:Enoyl-CoA hydratase-related protein n=1 Tax=Pseudonocardia yunnanensis TaxID=58107 RepID=A0ABW4FCP5_9PSEU